MKILVVFIMIFWAGHAFAFEPTKKLEIYRADTNLRLALFDVAIADEDDERRQGLMHIKSLPKGSGMLFVFGKETEANFWMKNTYLSLDILFIDRNFRIVQIEKNKQPLDLTPIVSQKPVSYALEIAGGQAEKRGLSVGDKVRILQ
jgi:hypothetical protein